MVTVAAMLRKLQAVDPVQEIAEVIQENLPTILELNRKQLKQGKGRDGKHLSPKYSEDPWFKSAESAARYAAWKQRLNPDAPFDTPDLYINGTTHRALFGEVNNKMLHIDSAVPWAASLEQKYRGLQFGLNEESKEEFRPTLMPPVLQRIKNKTGLQ